MFKKLIICLNLIVTTSLFSSFDQDGWGVYDIFNSSMDEVIVITEIDMLVREMHWQGSCLPKRFSQFQSKDVKLFMRNIELLLQADEILARNKDILSKKHSQNIQVALDSYKKSYRKEAQDHYQILMQKNKFENESWQGV